MNKRFEGIAIILAVIGVFIALLAWLAPFSPIGTSPLAGQNANNTIPIETVIVPANSSNIVGSDTVLYDDFNDNAYDGKYNLEKWIIDMNGGKIYQQDGALVAQVDSSLGDGISLSAVDYQNIKIETPMFFEAKLMIKEPINGHVFLYLGSSSSSGIFSDCTLGYGDVIALLDCGYVVNGVTEYRQDDELVNFTTWHTVRIEVEPQTMTLTYYLDGQKIHSFIPSNSAYLKSGNFTLQIGIVSDDKKSWTGFIDDVSIGQIP
ncbi:MAG TPA: hypothetical protein PLT08_13010 [Anaerolineales bacterium]|nr:hypothetical protein [Anaerolineales bacterium]